MSGRKSSSARRTRSLRCTTLPSASPALVTCRGFSRPWSSDPSRWLRPRTAGYIWSTCAADELVASVGTGMFQKHIGVRLKRGEGLSGQIWAENRPIPSKLPVLGERAGAFEGEPIGPAMGVPLYVDGQVTGVIGLTRLVYSKPFTADELDAMAGWPSLPASCSTNARLRNSLELELAARVDAQAALQVAYEGLEQRVQERTGRARRAACAGARAAGRGRAEPAHRRRDAARSWPP